MATKRTISNPFSITSYIGKDYFCDREAETEQICKALYNRRNITLISPRKMGKTGLIKNVFDTIGEHDAHCFYVDIYNTSNLREFIKVFAENVFTKRLRPFTEHAWQEISRYFSNLRPVFSIDPITGTPQCSIDVQAEHEENTLRTIFDYLEQADKRCFVAFDEFQTIAEYSDSKMEATLRSYIQHLNNVQFIFAGSKKHVMLQMFSSANRPFFQSSQLMDIDVIPEGTYYTFSSSHLQRHGQQMDAGTFHELYTLVGGHTWYVQVMLNRLYESAIKEIKYEDVLTVIDQWLQEQSPIYQTYSRLLTNKQLNIMRAVAHEGFVKEPGSSKFLQKYDLGAYSTVRSIIKTLTDKELLYPHEDGGYSVYDRFWGIWLRHN
ncbi:MAG: ATP-binding protein [Paludibacteraceae bacterium]|nr:ATP-binding protein [Paludibacteraceae bacterium]